MKKKGSRKTGFVKEVTEVVIVPEPGIVREVPEVAVIPEIPVTADDNKKTFDEIVGNPELLQTLRDVLFERGYIVVTEDELVRELATQRVITGNTARLVIRDVVKNILAKEVKSDHK